MTQAIAIFGAGGSGREVLQIVEDINAQQATWSCAGFLVDAAFAGAGPVAGLPVLGDLDWLAAHPEVQVVVALGSPAARRRIVRRIEARCGNRFATLVHPRAWVGSRVEIGAGTVVCAGAMVTNDIRIADHVQVNVGCTVSHDSVLEDFVTLSPGVNVCGNVHIHEGTEVGAGTAIIPRCALGSWSIVGAGAVVTRAVPENVTAVGVPARVIATRAPDWHLA